MVLHRSIECTELTSQIRISTRSVRNWYDARMRQSIRSFTGFVVFLCVCQFTAAEHSSKFTFDCWGGITFYLAHVGDVGKQEFVLVSRGGGPAPWQVYLPEKTWKEVVGKRCSSSKSCESATSARIWIEETNSDETLISGKYQIVFGEQHFDGQFRAKLKKKRVECL